MYVCMYTLRYIYTYIHTKVPCAHTFQSAAHNTQMNIGTVLFEANNPANIFQTRLDRTAIACREIIRAIAEITSRIITRLR